MTRWVIKELIYYLTWFKIVGLFISPLTIKEEKTWVFIMLRKFPQLHFLS